jgi:hypothetical protein
LGGNAGGVRSDPLTFASWRKLTPILSFASQREEARVLAVDKDAKKQQQVRY